MANRLRARKRWIFLAGLGVGYVLGTKAGREKFDRMVARAHRIWESPIMQEAAGVARAQAARLAEDGWHLLAVKVLRVSPTKDHGKHENHANHEHYKHDEHAFDGAWTDASRSRVGA